MEEKNHPVSPEDGSWETPWESILNIVGSLTGTAWRLVEDYDVSKAEDESSFADLFCWTGTFSIMIEFNSLRILTATLP